ncbi:TPA: AAA family ATPase [Candidatus Dependentiae bacterium]|nr:AAA family ATPase [Candidatus Dependentiae bacterium]
MTEQKKKKLIPIGIDDFKELVEQNYYFADKSLLIKELLDSGAKVTLLPRPRRFGKTLNLSMLRYFFEKVVDDRSYRPFSLDTSAHTEAQKNPLIPTLRYIFPPGKHSGCTDVSRESGSSYRHFFNGLKIEQYADCMKHQGQYPVIWLTFKDVKSRNWAECYHLLRKQISGEFARHSWLGENLSSPEREQFEKIRMGEGDLADYMHALLDLSRYLEHVYKAKVMILIDEYDAPIHAGYLNGYYSEIIDFIRVFMGAGLKGNNSLNFGVLTGILRVAKESIFSGINNLRVCTLVQESYANQFGFLEDEVAAMLAYFELENKLDEVRRWYNGYQSGSYKVYNPWSIINLAGNKGVIQAYWVNTSDNLLVRDILKKSQPYIKEDVEKLMHGESLHTLINENLTLLDIDHDENALWNFLLLTGYVTFENYHQEGRFWYADLKIPNEEIASLYETTVLSWFKEKGISQDYLRMLTCLTHGDAAEFKRMFELFSYEALSSFDITGREPERLYHALTIGMFVALQGSHEVRSNRESGLGRYDVSLIPKDLSKPGIILEFKKVDVKKKETLETASQKALNQIEERDYETELRARGLKNIIKLGIAFKGKESLVLIG